MFDIISSHLISYFLEVSKIFNLLGDDDDARDDDNDDAAYMHILFL